MATEQQTERTINLAYEKQLSAAIVGIAININTLHAKMKLSQNKNQAAREDVLQISADVVAGDLYKALSRCRKLMPALGPEAA